MLIQLHMRVLRLYLAHSLLVITMNRVAGLHLNHIGRRRSLYLDLRDHLLKGWLYLLELDVSAIPFLSLWLVGFLLILHVDLRDFFKRSCDFETKEDEE